MNSFLSCFLVGISLSMDAFSLALVYGTYGMSDKRKVLLAFIVGVFHFFMPLLGLFLGSFVVQYFNAWLVGFIFMVIGIEMFFSIYKDTEVRMIDSLWGYFLFGFAVSVDSFTTGIGLSFITNRYLVASLIFMICSGFFTYVGLFLGDRLSRKFGNIATLIGGIILFLLGLYYFLSL